MHTNRTENRSSCDGTEGKVVHGFGQTLVDGDQDGVEQSAAECDKVVDQENRLEGLLPPVDGQVAFRGPEQAAHAEKEEEE